MSEKTKQEDNLEGLLVSILGVLIVLGGVATVYFLMTRVVSGNISVFEIEKDPLSKWVWLGFGTLFFLYGLVGVIREKIGVGWGGTAWKVTTVLEGAGAFVSGVGTVIGGLLMLATAAIYFYPSLSSLIDPFTSLLCGFASIILSWICGPIIRKLEY